MDAKTRSRIAAAIASKMNVTVFRVRVRTPLLEALLQMHKLAAPALTLELYLSELVEGCVAEWRQVRTDADARLLQGPPAALVPTPEIHSGCKPKLSAEDIEKVFELKDEGVAAAQIAKRFRVSAQTIRRYYDE